VFDPERDKANTTCKLLVNVFPKHPFILSESYFMDLGKTAADQTMKKQAMNKALG